MGINSSTLRSVLPRAQHAQGAIMKFASEKYSLNATIRVRNTCAGMGCGHPPFFSTVLRYSWKEIPA